ncbi:zinc finger MYM-type protein 1-like [Tripterygium wilfordii]|uniref:zinc finger MYM-type protein 1-like n=1 Tax=Tripterygium wilfordii TaxID=458696 RepID=UPI0018F811E3|nr:zinc finger MYM-type protein 1-like [Tripterygium wilfordii]
MVIGLCRHGSHVSKGGTGGDCTGLQPTCNVLYCSYLLIVKWPTKISSPCKKVRVLVNLRHVGYKHNGHHQAPPKRGKTLFSFFKKKDGIPDDQQNAAAQTSIPNLRTSETVVVESSIPNYSPSKDKAYCFPCFIIETKSSSALVNEGFNNWKRVNNGEKCVFLVHVGSVSSSHNNCVRCVQDLMKPTQRIDKVMNAQSKEDVMKNRLRLKTAIQSIRWLAFQGCAFRGHDQSPHSLNRGNFIEMVKMMATLNEDIAKVVLENAPQNATYTSPKIQKEILHLLANKVRMVIREEIGDASYCILVDEAQDAAKREQMAIVLRFVNRAGILIERFFDIVGVSDTAAITLKNEISVILTRYNLQVQMMRGQRYGGASNMRGAWNGLQALFLKDCPYAYYVHCFAHRLQLALVATAKEMPCI